MDETQSISLLAVGVGHAGCDVLAAVDAARVDRRFDRLGIDTDSDELERIAARGMSGYLAGEEACKGRGVHGDAEQALLCMEDAAKDFAGMLKGRSLLVVVAGLGGCTGGALEPLLKTAEELQIPVVLLGILPFPFESVERRQRANAVLNDIEMYCQTVILAPNDLLMEEFGALPVERAFAAASGYLGDVLLGVTTPFSARPLLNMDTGILGVLGRSGTSRCHFAQASGENAESLLRALRGQPLFLRRDAFLRHADCAVALLRLKGECKGDELDQVMSGIGGEFPEGVSLETSACVDSRMGAALSVTLLVHQAEVSSGAVSGVQGGMSRPRYSPVVSAELLGIFAGDVENVWKGENLDIPTFRRRGVSLDRGK